MNDSTSATSPVWPTRWPPNSFTGLWTWLLAGAIAVIFGLVFLAGIRSSGVPRISSLEFDILILFQLVFEGALLLIVLAALPILSKFSLRELGFCRPSLGDIGVAILGAIAMVVLSNGGASLIEYLAHSRHQQDIVEIFRQLHDPATVGLFAGFAVVFAPFAEETFFRVFFFNLGLRYGGFWIGAIVSGLLFGLAHGDAFAAVPLMLGGIVLCAVYYRTRNAFAPMISHAAFNTLSIVALLVAPGLTS
ncbi:MAG: CPBP family intramembrane metalloprotease [Candidatus Eremiobacteraeota bacterium]|nr:CPBP family intramembrane metalloprotease [Candidatus Eremiobacteraeota bacterium]MBV9056290.1 CPBP family intramembrane metalloprotease [Candidatus Eremiobacteraeota bacterium]